MNNKEISIKINENCSCREKGITPYISMCGNNKKEIEKRYKEADVKITIDWGNGKSKKWIMTKLEKSIDYYGDETKEYMEEYEIWLQKSALQEMLAPIRGRQITKIELQEIKEDYLNEIYKKEITVKSNMSYQTYKKDYMYINNPYIGYYLENLWVLACIELPWKIKILPSMHESMETAILTSH